MIYPPKFYSKTFHVHADRILTEAQARTRHEEKKDYFCILKPLIGMHQTIGFALRVPMLTVHWVDKNDRSLLIYSFRSHSSKLFLEHVRQVEFQNEADYLDRRVAKSTSYTFKPDGTYTGFQQEAPDMSFVDTWTGRFDAAANWEELPEFGEYDRFLKKERGEPLPAPTGPIKIDRFP